MKKKHYLSKLFVLFSVLLLLAGVLIFRISETGKKVNVKPVIGFSHINMTHSFYKSWIKEQKKTDVYLGTESIHRNSDGDIDKQISDIRDFIQMDVDVIMINPIDVIEVEGVVSEAIEAGIPCISSANIIDVPGVINAILPEYDVMSEVAHVAAAYLGKKGNVLYLAGKVGNWASDHRLEGFINSISHYPDINVLEWREANFDYNQAHRIAEEWLGRFPEINMIVANDDALASPVIEVIKQAGRQEEIKVFSYTSEPRGINAVINGDLIGNTLVSTERFAWWNAQMFQRVLKGERMEFSYMDVPIIITEETYKILEKNNMYQIEDLEWITPEGSLEAVKNAREEFTKSDNY